MGIYIRIKQLTFDQTRKLNLPVSDMDIFQRSQPLFVKLQVPQF